MTTDADRVKPLEWTEYSTNIVAWAAGYRYSVSKRSFGLYIHDADDVRPIDGFKSVEEAQAAAQADLRAVIAALAPEPQAADAPEFVPTERLEQIVGTQLALPAETHDMAVELIIRRRTAAPLSASPDEDVLPCDVQLPGVMLRRGVKLSTLMLALDRRRSWDEEDTRLPPALRSTSPAECATEGCSNPATVRFERGGVGSTYCRSCYMRIQALPAAAQEGNGNGRG